MSQMNIMLTITLRCREILSEDSNAESSVLDGKITNESYNDINIELKLTKKDIINFLFKFSASIFNINNKIIRINYNEYKRFSNIALFDNDTKKSYIVMNASDVWTELLKAYNDIVLFERIQSISFKKDINEEDM